MTTEERFLSELTAQITASGGASRFGPARARGLAEEVLRRLREIGADAYPSLLDVDDLRFVYQWDAEPPLLTIMVWFEERMWIDVARQVVPPDLIV